MTTDQKPGTFTKGDARINRKGRPRSFDALRALVLEIGNEVITNKDGSVQTTRIQAIIRDWFVSNNFQKQKAILEIAFGKVPDQVELTGKDGGVIETTTKISPEMLEFISKWQSPKTQE